MEVNPLSSIKEISKAGIVGVLITLVAVNCYFGYLFYKINENHLVHSAESNSQLIGVIERNSSAYGELRESINALRIEISK